MKHFPVFLDIEDARILLSGGGGAAVSKLRLLLKTTARITVFSFDADPVIRDWAAAGRIALEQRPLNGSDLPGALLVYAADEDSESDARTAALARDRGVLVNVVDNLHDSDFITPAIVDRDPVTVAIGTEGTAPMLARKVKADIEARLVSDLGERARAAEAFRPQAERLPGGRARRSFWSEYFDTGGADLAALLDRHLKLEPKPGHIAFVGAGPGDPDDLTLRARKALDTADVVIHDRLVPQPILELARREAIVIEAGKTGFGESTPQDTINRLIVEHAGRGAQVVRLKSGDPTVFGRLDEEIEACDAAGVPWSIVPGITAASAAVAAAGQSLTKRGRNSAVRLMTGHDAKGFAEHDWKALARAGEVAAIYMGKRAARFVQGRLLMHGADPSTPITVVENAGRPDQRVLASTISRLEPDLGDARLGGPALILLGIAPRHAAEAAMPAREALQ